MEKGVPMGTPSLFPPLFPRALFPLFPRADNNVPDSGGC
ncbi:hypothetical protein T45_04684 [Streptomyces turgidiscabies]|nr:hypothetical protein T45_04684 [Streptomyces turgidiscabies]